ncbi:hypothetical protein [Mycobacterium servetii]|uniref:Alanine and proline rich protein n=1 Tax=Mycobacterium servetii TaxID=3237418 RepID=A0ABV4CB39_9MYCO
MSFGEASFPASPYAPEILALSWPSQSSTLWGGLAMEFETEVSRLRGLLNTQMDIIEVLMTMSGEFIKSAVRLGRLAEIALRDRIELYETAARLAHAGATEISMTKDDLTQIVKQADDAIKQAQEDAAKQEAAAMGNPIAIGVIEGALVGTIEGIVANAAAEAQLRDGEAAAKVGGYSMELAQLSSTGDMLGQGTTSEMGSGIPAAPAFNGGGVPASPAPRTAAASKPSQPRDTTKPQRPAKMSLPLSISRSRALPRLMGRKRGRNRVPSPPRGTTTRQRVPRTRRTRHRITLSHRVCRRWGRCRAVRVPGERATLARWCSR